MKRNLFISFGRFNRTIFLSLLLLLCFSCKKEEPQVNQPSVTNDGISFHDGRLIFENDTAFINHQRWLFANQGNPQLIAEKNKCLGLKSMTEYFLEGMKMDEMSPEFEAFIDKYPNVFRREIFDNSTLYFLPHSSSLCYVANKDGIYQIEDRIYKIADRCLYQIKDETKIELLFLPKDQILENGIKVIPSTSGTKDYAQRTITFPSYSNFRMVSSLVRNYDEYSETWELWTNPQHRVMFIWGRAQLDTKSAKGDGVYAYTDGYYVGSSPGYYCENTGMSVLVTWQAFNGWLIDKETTYAPAYSRARLNSEYIYTYWDDIFDYSPTVTNPSWTPETEPF